MSQASDNETITVGALRVRFLIDAAHSDGAASVFECDVPAHAKMPAPHSHDGFEETIYGLEGVSTWTVDGVATDIGPGDAICIRRGAVHHFDNRGEVDAKALAIATPGVFGPDYFHEVAAVFADAAGGPPDLERIGAVMRRHGLTPEPPPAS